jgi:mannosyltransferase OCH1-like enzyme
MEEIKKYLENTETINGIPKIIHQNWMGFKTPGGSKTPPGGFINQNINNVKIIKEWEISQKEWKRLHPDWKYILWTSDVVNEFIDTYYPEYSKMFKKLPYDIQRADTIRYFILRDFGGVYSDLDIVPLKSLNEYKFIDSDIYIMKSANTPCCYTNSFMISKQGVKVWTNLIKYIEKYELPWYAIGKHLTVMTSTGPEALTRVVNNYDDNICVLPLSLFNSSNVDEIDKGLSKDKAINNNSMIYHIEGKSWNGWDSKIINFFYMHTDLVIFLCILFIVWMIYTRIYYKNELIKCKNLF